MHVVLLMNVNNQSEYCITKPYKAFEMILELVIQDMMRGQAS